MIKQQRFSRKRDSLLQALRETDAHPTAEWLYNELKPQYPDLSLGTVYRNLAVFKQEGRIRSLGVFAGQEHFDFRCDPHPHFYCEVCGAVSDLDFEPLDSDAVRNFESENDIIIKRSEISFYGKCSICSKK